MSRSVGCGSFGGACALSVLELDLRWSFSHVDERVVLAEVADRFVETLRERGC